MDKAKIIKKKCDCNKPISKYNKTQLEEYINNKQKPINKKKNPTNPIHNNKEELIRAVRESKRNKEQSGYISGYRKSDQTCLAEESFLIQSLKMSQFEKRTPAERKDFYKRGRAFVKVMNLPSNKRPIKYKFCEDKKKRNIENKLNIIEKRYGKRLTK